ncbi:TPA: hypothetical protein ACR8QZ_003804 [Enterobacter roggenkampii]
MMVGTAIYNILLKKARMKGIEQQLIGLYKKTSGIFNKEKYKEK